ncbi:hypothetical protein AU255_06265 [Methyloprofundus sedimenti]|uniref:Uncharacterized protein n=1 Tax=Methyloprofundus sedimenti TaxID=1420851 RepID=A0A1V8M7C7_9GAMM|nr:DUF6789 family protein [Methyloprofundus sedimenti]OQK17480.1 hypothetical protein AU255_06265 [Methyloprofundus sedimenti]
MKSNITKTILGGFVGTLMMSLMMKFAAPMLIGHPMDIAAMLGNMMGGVYALGMAAHMMLGIVVFPLIYAFLFLRFLPGAPVIKGMLFGTILWLMAATVIMPMAGAGFFMSEIGGIKAAMAALMGHLVYGGLLGVVIGKNSYCANADKD